MKKRRILPLTLVGKSVSSVQNWRPFDDATLNDLIDGHNDKCRKSHINLGWTREDIEEMVWVVDIVQHDLTRLDKLGEADFEDIYILLVDLIAVKGRSRELSRIRHYMSRKRHYYYLVQVSQDLSANHIVEEFAALPIYPVPSDPPYILSTQKEFEDFLRFFCVPFPPPPDMRGYGPDTGGGPGNGGSRQAYINAISKVVEDVRSTAITLNLSEEETMAFAHRAALQEFALSSIEEQIRPQARHEIVLNALREPIVKLAMESRYQTFFQSVDLVGLRPAHSIRNLTSEQRKIFYNLGVRGRRYTAVNFDLPSTWDVINKLGDSVEVSKFSARLPF